MAVVGGIVGLDAGQADEVGVEVVVLLSSQIGEVGLERVGGTPLDTPLCTVEHGLVVHAGKMLEVQSIQELQELAIFPLAQFPLSLARIQCSLPGLLVNSIVKLFPVKYDALGRVLDAEGEWRVERGIEGTTEDNVARCKGAVKEYRLGHPGKRIGQGIDPEIGGVKKVIVGIVHRGVEDAVGGEVNKVGTRIV